MPLSVGIDLGTTNSCIAVYRNHSVEIIESDDGKKTIPSYVYYEPNGKIVVGREATTKLTCYPEKCIYDSKRFIGINFNDAHIELLKTTVSFNVNKDEDGKCSMIVVQNEQKRKIRPEEVSAEILKELKRNAEKKLGEKIINVVITVPAYFNNAQKEATHQAAKIAGLNVLKLVTEPVAAALTFTHGVQMRKEKLVLVYDLGGGTFDVSLVKLSGKNISTIGISGDNFLGGRDFDFKLMEHILDELDRGLKNQINAVNKRRIQRRIQRECEELKKALSQSEVVETELYELFEEDVNIIITRREFEDLNREYFKKTIKILDKLLSDAKIKKKDIDEVLLIGGSTRIPKIQQMISDYFGNKELNNTVNPDEAVAIGAAIQAALLSNNSAQKCPKYAVTDVVPRSLGIEVVGEITMSVIVESNTKIPCEIKKTYFTNKDYQKDATFRIFEGENADVKENNLLGEFVIQNITQKKKGEVQFNVKFSLDLNGILKVTATETLQKKSRDLVITLYSGRMTKKETDEEDSHMMVSRRVK